MKVGDKIRLQMYIMGHPSHLEDFVVEEFRHCLGIFKTRSDRVAEAFTPLCELYGTGPDSENKYLSNYGEYQTNQVPVWMDITEIKYNPEDC